MTRSRFFAMMLALLVALPAASGADPLKLYGTGVQLVRHSDMRLTGKMARGFAEFRTKRSYFGAIFVNPASDDFFSVWDFHDLETAIAFAEGGCERVSRSKPGSCVLIATALPRELPANTKKASSLGLAAVKRFRGAYLGKQRAGSYGAFAISGLSDWAYNWEKPTEDEARGNALTLCQASADRAIADFPNEARTLITKAGLNRCRVVHLSRP